MATFVLVHSPLVGPTTWSRVASEIAQRGHDVVVPSLVEAARTGRWQNCVDAVVGACPDVSDLVVVAHSGAGPLLPVIARRRSAPPACSTFVDAGVPPVRGDAALVPEEYRTQLRAMAIDGRLPKWSEWFGPDTMRALLPEADLRDAIVAEMPQLPLSYFDDPVPMPDGWTRSRCAYILLSAPYRADADRARALDWPVRELSGTHLDILTRPRVIAAALLDLSAPHTD